MCPDAAHRVVVEGAVAAGDTTAGAIVYGYTDSTGMNLTQKIVVAYEKATDTIPLAAWLLYKTPTTPVETELYNTRTDTTLRRAGYFQLVVPANIAIGKLELRDTNNVVLRTQTSTLWKAGPKGSKTDLSAQQNIVLDVEAEPPALPSDRRQPRAKMSNCGLSWQVAFPVPDADCGRPQPVATAVCRTPHKECLVRAGTPQSEVGVRGCNAPAEVKCASTQLHDSPIA